jgi:hypothetical protein
MTAGSGPTTHPSCPGSIASLRRDELAGASVGVLDVDLTTCQKADMRVLAQVRADDGLHVPGPPEARRVNDPLHPALARAGHVDLHSSDFAVLGARDRGERTTPFSYKLTLPSQR